MLDRVIVKKYHPGNIHSQGDNHHYILECGYSIRNMQCVFSCDITNKIRVFFNLIDWKDILLDLYWAG